MSLINLEYFPSDQCCSALLSLPEAVNNGGLHSEFSDPHFYRDS